MSHNVAPPAQLLEARDLMAFGAIYAGDERSHYTFLGAHIALTWAIRGCECGCVDDFEDQLTRLRAQNDQFEAGRRRHP